ncbi:MAG: biotin attachment protein [Ignavibacteriae bacterium]|nr:MAG: biotin attachment protein [Ignavibacteriota bacterium]
MQKKKVKFMCTAFRDGFQSVYGARVLTKDFLPAVEAAKEAGITYFESGGGARFQSLYFYCQEDAFEMMDKFRETAGSDANLQTLARGVNVVGLDSQSSDIIRLHAQLFKKHGVTTIRNFDALNDVNNLIYSGQAIKEAGLKHQVCVTLMELPPDCSGAHTPEFYEETLRKILEADIPFDSVCFKDASGTAVPSKVYETVKRARKLLPEGTEIHFHTHDTAGTAIAANLAALDAGADLIDLSMKPCSGGTCQPDILTMWHALRGSEYELDVDVDKILVAEDVFQDCMKDYFLPPEAVAVEPIIPWSPMPGGALTANTQMLRDNKIMHRYHAIIKAMGDVVKKGGFGTSVTPVSQFYFQQAFNNVIFGEWKNIAPTYGKMVLGYFGKTPVAPDPEVVKIASEQLNMSPTTEKVLTLNNADPKKGIEPARKMLLDEGLDTTDENIFIAATCKEKGIAFLKGEAKLGIRLNADETTANSEISTKSTEDTEISVDNISFTLMINGKSHQVKFNNSDGNGKIAEEKVAESSAVEQNSTEEKIEAPTNLTPIKAIMPGKIWKVFKNVGDEVAEEETVFILEAMKMENEIKSPMAGKIAEILVKEGDHVPGETVLAKIK